MSFRAGTPLRIGACRKVRRCFSTSRPSKASVVNEAVLLDNFYRSTITPLFFVECLADLEREMFRMKGTPEQLVGSLAERTPDCQSSANVHHMDILKGELSGQFNLDTTLLRPFVSSGKVVQLGDSQGHD